MQALRNSEKDKEMGQNKKFKGKDKTVRLMMMVQVIIQEMASVMSAVDCTSLKTVTKKGKLGVLVAKEPVADLEDETPTCVNPLRLLNVARAISFNPYGGPSVCGCASQLAPYQGNN